ncbi:AmmeMemoRadiSam system protein A [Chloroflexota bacterium]
MSNTLPDEEREILLKLARQALEDAVRGEKLLPLEMAGLPTNLQQPGATFVTLTKRGQLRGCIGSLQPTMPLAEDVREHAVAAGLQDFRFHPVSSADLPEIVIEISRLTLPQDLSYDSHEDLLNSLRPGLDGVTILDGYRRATFLPQVWEKIPDPSDFLDHLCNKMGAQPDLWRKKMLKIQVYQVEEFHE